MDWGATEWGAVASGVSAAATAAAGFMALLAAKWTVSATRKAAEENSSLLKKQIEVQRQQLEAEQRPWIRPRFEFLDVVPTEDPSEVTVRIKIFFENIGKTPAIHTLIVQGPTNDSSFKPDNVDFGDIGGGLTVLPGSSLEMSSPLNFKVRMIGTRRVPFLFIGAVFYRSEPNGPRHMTPFHRTFNAIVDENLQTSDRIFYELPLLGYVPT